MSGLCRSIRAPYDAQKVAYNRSWDDLDLESTFEHRRQEGLMFIRVLRLSASAASCPDLAGLVEGWSNGWAFLRSGIPHRAIGLRPPSDAARLRPYANRDSFLTVHPARFRVCHG